MLHLHTSSEHELQAAVFEHRKWRVNQDHRWLYVVGVPNGCAVRAERRERNGKVWWDSPTRRRLVEEGLTPGLPDILVLYPSGGYHGAAIELKIPPNRASSEQQNWKELLTRAGWLASIISTFDPLEVVTWIDSYFSLETPK